MPWLRDLLKMTARIGASSMAHSLRKQVERLSGPAAFLGLRCCKSFCIQLAITVNSVISGYERPSGHGDSPGSSCVKTDGYWRFSMLALSTAALKRRPLSLSGAKPVLSFRSDSMYDQNNFKLDCLFSKSGCQYMNDRTVFRTSALQLSKIVQMCTWNYKKVLMQTDVC